MTLPHRPTTPCLLLIVALLVNACGGSGGGSGGSSSPAGGTGGGPTTPPPINLTRVSAASPYTANCQGNDTSGTLYTQAEVEPYAAINPIDPNNIIAVWQQDRWSNGASRGTVTGVSFDRGVTWAPRVIPYSRCGGGEYERASDPWVTFSPNGVAYQMALAVTGTSFTATSINAMLVSRSTDGGRTWAAPVTLIRDVGAQFFNDKNSITAHPTDARFAFATWDRLNASGGGPTYFARTTDGGLTWEPARPIYDPGPTSQTIGNEIVVMPNGTLINAYTQIDAGPLNRAFFAIVRSTDNGVTWSQPIRIADYQGIGTRDPETGAAIRDSSSLARIAVSAQGMLYLTWQDARFTNGARDSIALARSSDGGLTWSTPMRVNSDASTQALIPTIHVRADGTLGITHFDFRSNTTDPNTLPTDHWLLRSSDGGNTWREVRVSGPFDLAAAPVARGLFIGDYQALLSIGNQFVPVWVETNSDTNNRTDVYIRILSAADSANVTAGDSISTSYLAPTSAAAPMHEEWQRQTHERLTSVLARRRPPVLPTP